jgi:hypothetical protein
MAAGLDYIDELFRERVERARRMSDEQKLLAGPRLFDFACRVSRDGIRAQFPLATEEEVEQLLRERLALGRRLEARQ